HFLSPLFSTTLTGPRAELYRARSILRAPQEPPVPGRDSFRHVSALCAVPEKGRHHGQLPLSPLPPAARRRTEGLAVLAAGGLRTEGRHHANQSGRRTGKHRRA